ncbi:PMS1 protein homolog 1 [Halyomorpha halys]|uniref:PMS1 protein homolog 1 n=1 Tax=Halyomorpha halys TaxID=286706 RepID=UPI0006D4C8F8|nr:PMS1 protein homolog 1-like [Halyomorpha halys]
MSLKQLPPSTIKLISSTQVITSVSSVIKELIENSIDAGATNIEVKLENHGLDKIEVKDNGKGVKREEVQYMCKKSYTSKINNFDDLYKLDTYGFRGEALNSLCALATVTITTISEGEDVALTYGFDHDGNIKSNKISHIIKGTTIIVENLFKNLPVRKQFLTNGRRKMDEIKKVEQVVKTLAVIHPRLRVVLTHNKFCIWQKNCVSTLRQSLVQIIAPTIVKQLTDIKYESKNISFDLLVPARACNIASTCYGNPGDAMYLFINLRPIKNKIIEKIVQDEIFSYFGHEVPSGKYPTCLVSIKLPPDCLDVNLEPNKTRVIIKDIEEIGNVLKKQLVLYYIGPIDTPQEFHDVINEEIERNCIKRKNDELKNGGKKSKLELIEKVEYMTEGDDLEDCDGSDLKLINENCKTMTDEAGPVIHERDFNEISFMEGIVEGNIEILVGTEVPKSPVTVTDFEKTNLADTTTSDKNNSSTEENSGVANVDINIDNITLSQWSRGDVRLDGDLIKSSTVLLDCKTDEKKDLSYFNNQVDSCLNDSAVNSQVSTGERSVSSQMGCKDMAGFTKYASEAISKISKNGDGSNFTKVASELATKWREMNDIDKDNYLEKAKKKQKEKENKDTAVMRERLKKFLEKCNEKRVLKKRTYHTEIDLDINMESLKISVKERTSETELGFRFLGELNEDLKCVAITYDLYIFSTRRLQEALLYYKNLKTMIVPLKVLESGIAVKKDDLGESLWSILVSMETAIDVKCGAVIISDERISRNGLRIELIKEDPTGCSFLITDVPLHVAFFGLDDLKEILSLIETSNPELPLEDCRPLKILSYIRGETIRFISKNDVDQESDRVIDEFRFWLDHVKPKTKRCPHQKAVFKRINLKDFI